MNLNGKSLREIKLTYNKKAALIVILSGWASGNAIVALFAKYIGTSHVASWCAWISIIFILLFSIVRFKENIQMLWSFVFAWVCFNAFCSEELHRTQCLAIDELGKACGDLGVVGFLGLSIFLFAVILYSFKNESRKTI